MKRPTLELFADAKGRHVIVRCGGVYSASNVASLRDELANGTLMLGVSFRSWLVDQSPRAAPGGAAIGDDGAYLHDPAGAPPVSDAPARPAR